MNLHYPSSRVRLHYPYSRASLHCPSSRASLHCPSSRASLHCPSSRASLHFPSSRASLHCPSSRASLHCPSSRASSNATFLSNHDGAGGLAVCHIVVEDMTSGLPHVFKLVWLGVGLCMLPVRTSCSNKSSLTAIIFHHSTSI